MNKTEDNTALYLIRGVPGSGKTTFAEQICESVYSADDYFTNAQSGEYNFDASKLHHAHMQCQHNVERHMESGESLAVANTFTTMKEMKPYYKLAEAHGYTVFAIVVENRHGGKDVHNVPADTIQKMKDRFDICL